MMNAKQKILDRVKKLLALSQSPNENEAAQANEKAHAIMLEHNIQLDQLGVTSDDKDEDYIFDEEIVTDSLPWRRRIGNAVATMYFCGYLFMHESEGVPGKPGYKRWDRHMFTGEPSNVAVVKVMFLYLTEAIDQAALYMSRDCVADKRTAYRVSFKNAAAERLSVRIYRRIMQAKQGQLTVSNGSKLPVLASMYDRAVKKNNDKIQEFASGGDVTVSTSLAKTNISHKGGAEAGRKLGDALGLDQQIGKGGETVAMLESLDRAREKSKQGS
jgi:Protein of unknown function (DUF2786)